TRYFLALRHESRRRVARRMGEGADAQVRLLAAGAGAPELLGPRVLGAIPTPPAPRGEVRSGLAHTRPDLGLGARPQEQEEVTCASVSRSACSAGSTTATGSSSRKPRSTVTCSWSAS